MDEENKSALSLRDVLKAAELGYTPTLESFRVSEERQGEQGSDEKGQFITIDGAKLYAMTPPGGNAMEDIITCSSCGASVTYASCCGTTCHSCTMNGEGW